ncbi:hypothetical protein I5803_12240 [Caenimonas sp. DR4.4]|uniref:Alkaline phytoceramidase n=2 Tax=Caenimonas aquaedulcis TaxID=2793270 RepID=A0A931H5F5_9BURK|nr:hypothetical protein [Caenimonas aquaedulcis]
MSRLSKAELALLAAVACMSLFALLGPAVALPAGYHHFADARALGGIPFAGDVLSNLPFAVMGVAGLLSLARAGSGARVTERALAGLFFAGLVFTAFASSWYHLQPDDESLAVDRIGMSVAFAGLLGLAAANRVSERAGALLAFVVLWAAPAAALHASSSGDAGPWAVIQFGGMLLVVAFHGANARHSALPIRWAWVIAAYALGKMFEVADHEVFVLTGGAVSGHTIKHMLAALAAFPVLSALGPVCKPRQNVTRIMETNS